MDEILICKCGGELNQALHCKDCKRTWPFVENWMKWAETQQSCRQFSPAQQALIDAAEMDAASPRHANCDGAPDGGHSEECLALD